MKKSLFLLCLLLGMLGNCALVLAQPAQKLVNVVVSPDRIDWKCKAKEEVKFTVQVFKNENLLKDVVVDYELGPVPKIQAMPGLSPQRARAAASKSLPTSTGTGR